MSGTIVLTYGSATDAKYPQAFEVTGNGGTFSDSNNGLIMVDATIGSLVAIDHAAPGATNLLAPNDFSKFAVAVGLPLQNDGCSAMTTCTTPAARRKPRPITRRTADSCISMD